ncbi:MAG: sigma-70 family RNA polymerase sigma factor [Methyloceanibacter sp.]|jgi:RNA polymerase sigma-70 factor (ECF subfamily)
MSKFRERDTGYSREQAVINSDAVHSVDRRQVTELLEAAVAELPERFRVVFMLHEVESMTVEETAEALQIPRKTVKMRLLRARRKFQQELDAKLYDFLPDTFTFAGNDCDALTERVLAAFIAKERNP